MSASRESEAASLSVVLSIVHAFRSPLSPDDFPRGEHRHAAPRLMARGPRNDRHDASFDTHTPGPLHSHSMVITASQDARADLAPGRRRRWRGRARPDVIPQGDWPELAGRLLALRGVTDAATASAFLGQPGAQPDTSALPDIDIAVDRLARAARSGECVAVYGDFDVDGVTSAAQLAEALSSLGAAPMPYIPDRFSEGYGLNVGAIEALHRDGATLLVTADCGTSSIDEVARARELGMDVIILDHHTVPPDLPDATALVNPRVLGAAPGGLLELATAGLAFHVAPLCTTPAAARSTLTRTSMSPRSARSAIWRRSSTRIVASCAPACPRSHGRAVPASAR